MKKSVFIILFIALSIFPIRIGFQGKADNVIVLNDAAKTFYEPNQYMLVISNKDKSILVYKEVSLIREIKFEGTVYSNKNSSVKCKGVTVFNSKSSKKQQYYIEISQNNIISSVPIDKKGNIIEGGKNIIVSEEDILWMYENIPIEAETEVNSE